MKDESIAVHASADSGASGSAPMSATLAAMRDVLVEHYGIDDPTLSADRELASLGLDSLAFIEYTFELEKALHVVLPDLPRDMVTVGDMARFVEREISRQARVAVAN